MNRFPTYSLRLSSKLLVVDRPLVMGIINVTPDSFYSVSRVEADDVALRTAEMIADGADIIDIGAYSSRPGASDVCEDEEALRLHSALQTIRAVSSDIPVSVDTFRSRIARRAIEAGADIINDISGGEADPEMFSTVADLRVPYILMHMRGNPRTMQSQTDYPDSNPEAEIIRYLSHRIHLLHDLGVADIIADPGFGFSKTSEQNYRLLAQLPLLAKALRVPLLVGLSRKSMLTGRLNISADDALNATTAANMIALQGGASILRVHDVKAAREAVDIFMTTVGSIPPHSRISHTTD